MVGQLHVLISDPTQPNFAALQSILPISDLQNLKIGTIVMLA